MFFTSSLPGQSMFVYTLNECTRSKFANWTAPSESRFRRTIRTIHLRAWIVRTWVKKKKERKKRSESRTQMMSSMSSFFLLLCIPFVFLGQNAHQKWARKNTVRLLKNVLTSGLFRERLDDVGALSYYRKRLEKPWTHTQRSWPKWGYQTAPLCWNLCPKLRTPYWWRGKTCLSSGNARNKQQ